MKDFETDKVEIIMKDFKAVKAEIRKLKKLRKLRYVSDKLRQPGEVEKAENFKAEKVEICK